MPTVVIYSDKGILEWYRDNYESLKESMPEVINRIESMDRSLLVAECVRVHHNLILANRMNGSLRLTLNSMIPTKEGQ